MKSARTGLAAAILLGGALAGRGWEAVCRGGGGSANAAETAQSPTTAPAAGTTRPVTIRQRFVPAKDAGGTSFTALTPFDKDGVSRLFANVALASQFPVRRDGQTLFSLALLEGDDDHLVLEVREKDSNKKLELQRDKSVTLTVENQEYHILYPSVTVNGDAPPTRDTAFLVMTQRKK